MKFIFASVILSAQTKWIAHKSHSGSKENFKTALINHTFGIETSNFGMAPNPRVQFAALDSVIRISATKTALVTSLYCGELVDSYTYDSVRQTYIVKENEDTIGLHLWQPGKEIVEDHPVFSKMDNIEAMKEVLGSNYHFNNSMDSVVFVGFDRDHKTSKKEKEKKPQSKESNTEEQEQNELPIITSPPPPSYPQFLKWMCWLVALAIAFALGTLAQTRSKGRLARKI